GVVGVTWWVPAEIAGSLGGTGGRRLVQQAGVRTDQMPQVVAVELAVGGIPRVRLQRRLMVGLGLFQVVFRRPVFQTLIAETRQVHERAGQVVAQVRLFGEVGGQLL